MERRARVTASCREIVFEIMKCDNAFHFFRPFAPEEVDGGPGVCELGTRTLSFLEIQERLDGTGYEDPDEFVADVMLIWRNAKLCHPAGHPVHRAADVLARKSQVLLSLLPCFFTEEEEQASGLHRYVRRRLLRYRRWRQSHQ